MKKSRVAALLVIAGLAVSLSCPGKKKDNNLLIDGHFDDPSAWNCGTSTVISDGVCRAVVQIEKYHRQWLEICRQKISVEPDTDYRLTAKARVSLEPLRYGVFLGVRFPKGKVLKDREFLLFRDEMTPLMVEFNSGEQTSLVVFCGSWIDQSAEFTIDDIRLEKIKK